MTHTCYVLCHNIGFNQFQLRSSFWLLRELCFSFTNVSAVSPDTHFFFQRKELFQFCFTRNKCPCFGNFFCRNCHRRNAFLSLKRTDRAWWSVETAVGPIKVTIRRETKCFPEGKRAQELWPHLRLFYMAVVTSLCVLTACVCVPISVSVCLS